MKLINRFFYIDTREISAKDIPTYMDSVKEFMLAEEGGVYTSLKVAGKLTDYFIPTKSETRIEVNVIDLGDD